VNRVIAALALVLLASIAHAGNITYNLVNYPADQDGFSLSGQITTDGMVGTLSGTDVQSWSVTLRKADTSFAYDNHSGYLREFTGVSATNDQLLLLPGLSNRLHLVGTAIPNLTSVVAYNNYNAPASGHPSLYTGTAVPFKSDGWATMNPKMNGSEPWIIAQAVPEPSTLFLLATLPVFWFCRRRDI
jgi:hypothetical protein